MSVTNMHRSENSNGLSKSYQDGLNVHAEATKSTPAKRIRAFATSLIISLSSPLTPKERTSMPQDSSKNSLKSCKKQTKSSTESPIKRAKLDFDDLSTSKTMPTASAYSCRDPKIASIRRSGRRSQPFPIKKRSFIRQHIPVLTKITANPSPCDDNKPINKSRDSSFHAEFASCSLVDTAEIISHHRFRSQPVESVNELDSSLMSILTFDSIATEDNAEHDEWGTCEERDRFDLTVHHRSDDYDYEEDGDDVIDFDDNRNSYKDDESGMNSLDRRFNMRRKVKSTNYNTSCRKKPEEGDTNSFTVLFTDEELAGEFKRAHVARRTFPCSATTQYQTKGLTGSSFNIIGDTDDASSKGKNLDQPHQVECVAIWDHFACDKEELPFKCGEVISVVDRNDKFWWRGRLNDREGWFPTAFVQEIVDETSNKSQNCSLIGKLRKRSLCVKELLYTERSYLNILRDIILIYHATFKKSRYIRSSDVKTIFSNIADIHELHEMILSDLESCAVSKHKPETSFHEWSVSRVFKESTIRRVVQVYSTYTNSHQNAINTLRNLQAKKSFSYLLEKCRVKNGTNLDLASFLLTPIQKICRYQLQLSELLKYTPESHQDFNNLKAASESMKAAVFEINDRRRSFEAIHDPKAVAASTSNYRKISSSMFSLNEGSSKRPTILRKAATINSKQTDSIRESSYSDATMKEESASSGSGGSSATMMTRASNKRASKKLFRFLSQPNI